MDPYKVLALVFMGIYFLFVIVLLVDGGRHYGHRP